MDSLKKLGYSLAATGLVAEQSFAADGCGVFGCSKADKLNVSSSQGGETAIMNLIFSLLSFVTIIAVIYVLWAGFKILTGGGDDGKLKEGKSIIIQVVIGIIIMWLAYPIVKWVLSALAA